MNYGYMLSLSFLSRPTPYPESESFVCPCLLFSLPFPCFGWISIDVETAAAGSCLLLPLPLMLLLSKTLFPRNSPSLCSRVRFSVLMLRCLQFHRRGAPKKLPSFPGREFLCAAALLGQPVPTRTTTLRPSSIRKEASGELLLLSLALPSLLFFRAAQVQSSLSILHTG